MIRATVLNYLGECRDCFPARQLPATLRRLEIIAFNRKGDPQRAIAEALKLWTETRDRDDRLQVVRLYLSLGNVQAALPHLHALSSATELSASEALQRVCGRDGERRQNFGYKALWRFATKAGIPDPLLLTALGLGFKLGLESETQPLVLRMQRRAEAGDPAIWLVQPEDIVEHLTGQQQSKQTVIDQFTLGAVPIHMAAPALPPLAWLYSLDRPGSDDVAMGSLLIRHGSRPADLCPDFPWQVWNVMLDLTGLLLADQLDILGALERLKAPVKISPNLPESLYKLESDVSQIQPRMVAAAQAILDAHTNGTITLGWRDIASPEAMVVHERQRQANDVAGPTVDAVVRALQRVGEAEGVGVGSEPNGDGEQRLENLSCRASATRGCCSWTTHWKHWRHRTSCRRWCGGSVAKLSKKNSDACAIRSRLARRGIGSRNA